ncbi:hypothetical protein T484DRAFT_1890972, partial [Baffinella frigidus]
MQEAGARGAGAGAEGDEDDDDDDAEEEEEEEATECPKQARPPCFHVAVMLSTDDANLAAELSAGPSKIAQDISLRFADCALVSAIEDVVTRKLHKFLTQPSPSSSGARVVKIFLPKKRQRGSNAPASTGGQSSAGDGGGGSGADRQGLAGHMKVDELWELARLGYDAQGRAETLTLIYHLVALPAPPPVPLVAPSAAPLATQN